MNKKSWDRVGCALGWRAQATVWISWFIMNRTGRLASLCGRAPWRNSLNGSQQQEEAAIASLCTHWSIIHKLTWTGGRLSQSTEPHPGRLCHSHRREASGSYYGCAHVNSTHSFRLHWLPSPIYAVPGMEHRALCMLGVYSAPSAPTARSPALAVGFRLVILWCTNRPIHGMFMNLLHGSPIKFIFFISV